MSFLGCGNSTSTKLRAENTKNPRETRGKTALAATESPTNSADEADFFVASHKLLIEFDGRQHYDNSELWGGDQKLAEMQRHDQIKNRFAAKCGYRLVRIPYWDLESVEDVVLEELSLMEEELGHAV